MPATMKPGYHYFDVGEREISTGLYLTSVGWSEVRAGVNYPAPGHPVDYDFSWSRGRILTDTALVFIGTGMGEFETRAVTSAWMPGQAVLLPPGMWHRYRPARDEGWTEYWVTFSGEMAGRLWQQWEGVLPIQPMAVRAPSTFAREFARFIGSVMSETMDKSGQRGAQPLTWLAAGLNLLGRFVEEHLENAPQPTSDDGVDQALCFIRNHSHRPLTMEQVAAAVGTTRRTLERRFAQEVGQSPRQELERVRVQRARKLLVETSRPIKEIAFLCGFREPRGLIRAFRRTLGVVPGKVREDIRFGG